MADQNCFQSTHITILECRNNRNTCTWFQHSKRVNSEICPETAWFSLHQSGRVEGVEIGNNQIIKALIEQIRQLHKTCDLFPTTNHTIYM